MPFRLRGPWPRMVAGCAAIAGLSLLLPSAPTTDPWGWIVWGREVLHLDLSTVVPGPPSWKPLPVLVTTPLALTGAAAPALWLFVARLGALGSLVVAARLSARLAGPWAAVIAVAGLVLSTDWLRAFAHGYTEPLAVGLLLAAVDQHLSERPRRALALAALAALTRPRRSSRSPCTARCSGGEARSPRPSWPRWWPRSQLSGSSPTGSDPATRSTAPTWRG